jgi:hypothetical protein
MDEINPQLFISYSHEQQIKLDKTKKLYNA